jgi:CHASE2 domain-containing sensor protein
MRRWRKQSERQLLILVILVLVIVGGGIVGLVYGWGALLTALPCLLGGAGIILVLYLLLLFIERWVRR